MASPQQAPKLSPPAKVSEQAFMGVVWGGLAITFLTLIFRIASRLRGFKRLWWDDAVVVLAWLMLLGNAILWQLAKKGLYVLAQVQSGQELPPADFAAQVERYLRLSSGNLVLFYTTLWSVKLSFLIFFRRLGHNVNRQNVIWWTVFGVVAAGYITVIGTIQWNCLLRSFQTISATCSTRSAINFQFTTFRVNCAVDVVTDALIMLIPLNMLWKVQISMRQKLGLLSVFCITVFIMIIAIVRVSVITSHGQQADESWLYTWSNVEQIVALMVASLAAARALFANQNRGRRLQEEKDEPSGEQPLHYQRRMKPSVQLRNMDDTTITDISSRNDAAAHQELSSSSSSASQEMMGLPFEGEGVHVRSDYKVVSHREQPVGFV